MGSWVIDLVVLCFQLIATGGIGHCRESQGTLICGFTYCWEDAKPQIC